MIHKRYVICDCSFDNQYEFVCPHITKGMQYLKHTGHLHQTEYLLLVSQLPPDYIKHQVLYLVKKNWNLDIVLNKDLYKIVHEYKRDKILKHHRHTK